MLSIKAMNAGEVKLAQSWFEKKTGHPLLEDFFSCFNYIAYIEGDPVACMNLFVCHKQALVGWLISSPDSVKEARELALNELVKHCEKEAVRMGCTLISTYSSHEVTTERFMSLGFRVGDPVCTNLIKRIGV